MIITGHPSAIHSRQADDTQAERAEVLVRDAQRPGEFSAVPRWATGCFWGLATLMELLYGI